MKKNILRLAFLCLLFFVCLMSSHALENIISNTVEYNNSKSGLKSLNVQDAIDEIYDNISNGQSYKKVCKLLSGNLGEVSSKYECYVNDTTKYNFYLLAKNPGSV